MVAFATPFILPALRKHCLPYLPATDYQLSNLSEAFKRHSRKNSSFIDIGSGDGRICRLASTHDNFSLVHGVELNFLLVLYSRLTSVRNGQARRIKYYHRDLWQFPLSNYDSICIFGVESMMDPLETYLKESASKPQTIFSCRYPFKNLPLTEEIGHGIDTVWVYKLCPSTTYREKAQPCLG